MSPRTLFGVVVLIVGTTMSSEYAHAQVADTLFTWRGYAREAQCRVRVYRTVDDEKRSHTVVLQELAENQGPSITDDARHLAELIGRDLGLDPALVYWVFHYGAFSYAGATPNKKKELFLRAIFSRNKSGRLGAPSWRLLSRAEVEQDYTDRLFR